MRLKPSVASTQIDRATLEQIEKDMAKLD